VCETSWKDAFITTSFRLGAANRAIAHSLGWANSSFPNFQDDTGALRKGVTTRATIRSMPVEKLKTPAVVREARKFFGCPYMDGVELGGLL
jgi:hypothetical protein